MKDFFRGRAMQTLLLLAAAAFSPSTLFAEDNTAVDFYRDIKPLLSDRCFGCHGPDTESRQAELNLSDQDQVFSHESSHGLPLLTPGDLEKSEIYRRLVADDPEERMPPADADRQLSGEEIELVGRWIAAGARWEPHWSLQAVEPPPLPATQVVEGTIHPIDQFVRAQLPAAGLTPAPPATRERLIRRLSLDLTGLPPTTAETDAFLADREAGSYQRLVDRLLASPRYGIRMASSWLDLARYADTSGYQIDRYRDVWPWRDWVVQALNENMPFDEFITCQLGGDLLPEATDSQRLATAFNRLHRQNEESGAVPEEFRCEYVADRVITMGTALLGMTLECARCHNHKYDAITQKEFYQLCSFFDNIDEAGVNSSETDAMPVPTLLLASAEQRDKLSSFDRQIEAAEAELARYAAAPATRRRWISWREKNSDPDLPRPIADYPLESFAGKKLENRADAEKPGLAEAWPKQVDGVRGKGIELNGDTRLSFKEVGVFSRTDPFTLSLSLWTPETKKRAVILHRSRAALDAASRGYELLLEEGRLSFGLAHMWPGNALRIVTRDAFPLQQWTNVVVTYDGSSRARGAKIYVNGQLAAIDVVRDALTKDILYDREDIHLTIGERWRDAGFKDGRVDEFQVFDRALTPLEVARLDENQPIPASDGVAEAAVGEETLASYLDHVDVEYRKRRDEVQRLRKEQSALIEPIAELMVMREMNEPRSTYLLKRGLYDQRGEQVTPATPQSILPFDQNLPPNRLGLARWLFDPRHPLTARVAANRIWEMFFGRGLVDPPNDFGTQGNPPSHPQLLDWLAHRYLESDWDTKQLIRLIVTSATYRQSSFAEREIQEKDPLNRLLARGPRHRLSAEMIRDSALLAGGLLVERMGGPPVYPYQPPGLWKEKESRIRYEQSKGDDLYRRSLYTVWKRTSPPPAMVAFDAPSRSVCTASRQRTGTPLQALVLLNDVQFVEAARCFAQRILREGGTALRDQIEFAFRTATGRHPEPSETGLLAELYRQQHRYFAEHEPQARQLIQTGESPPDGQLDPIALAALTTVANTLLNHDEFVTQR